MRRQPPVEPFQSLGGLSLVPREQTSGGDLSLPKYIVGDQYSAWPQPRNYLLEVVWILLLDCVDVSKVERSAKRRQCHESLRLDNLDFVLNSGATNEFAG